MNSTADEIEAPPKFPRLRKSVFNKDKWMIVLFTDTWNGTVVFSKNHYPVGKTGEWEAQHFVDYHGTVTLSN